MCLEIHIFLRTCYCSNELITLIDYESLSKDVHESVTFGLSLTVESGSFGSLTSSQKSFHSSYSSKSFLNTIFVSISHHQAVIDMQDSCH